MLSTNLIIQEACEDLSRVGDGETVSPDLAASCEGLLNRAITTLNSDGFISLTVNTYDTVAAGSVTIKKLEEDEANDGHTIDMEPPDSVQGVARKVGIRYVRLTGSNRQTMDRVLTYGMPTQWSYGVSFETAPSGETRRVGTLNLNGEYPVELRIYENSSLPRYKLGDMIYLSPLYHDLLLYQLELLMVHKYKLYSYEERVQHNLDGAMAAIDTINANNRQMRNDDQLLDSCTKPAEDLLAGVGF